MGDGMIALELGLMGLAYACIAGGILGMGFGLATALVRLAMRRREVKDVATFVATRVLVGGLIGGGVALAFLFLSLLWR